MKKFEMNDLIYKQGEPSQIMYVIMRGRVQLLRNTPEKAQEIKQLGQGQTVGDLEFFSKENRTATAKALTEVEVLEIPFDQFQKQLSATPPAIQILMKNYSQLAIGSLKSEKAAVASDSLPPLREFSRVLASISLLALNFGVDTGEGYRIDFEELRRMAQNVFLLPTTKIKKCLEILLSTGHVSYESHGEDPGPVQFRNPQQLTQVAEIISGFFAKGKEDGLKISAPDVIAAKALSALTGKGEQRPKGIVRVTAQSYIDELKKIPGADATMDSVVRLVERKLQVVKVAGEGGVMIDFFPDEIERYATLWGFSFAINQTSF